MDKEAVIKRVMEDYEVALEIAMEATQKIHSLLPRVVDLRMRPGANFNSHQGMNVSFTISFTLKTDDTPLQNQG